METWRCIFERNELIENPKKWNDAQIKAFMQEEFPHSAGAANLGPEGKTGQYTVNRHRIDYNAGMLNRPYGKLPAHYSRRWTQHPKIKNLMILAKPRTGYPCLSHEDVTEAYPFNRKYSEQEFKPDSRPVPKPKPNPLLA